MILYGNGTYLLQMNNSVMENFYSQLVLYYLPPLLKEYSTPTQSIVAGSLLQKVQISPLVANQGSLITDSQLQIELINQFQLQILPILSNGLYMIHLPLEVSIGSSSSQACVYCGYHRSFIWNTHPSFILFTRLVLGESLRFSVWEWSSF